MKLKFTIQRRDIEPLVKLIKHYVNRETLLSTHPVLNPPLVQGARAANCCLLVQKLRNYKGTGKRQRVTIDINQLASLEDAHNRFNAVIEWPFEKEVMREFINQARQTYFTVQLNLL